MTEPPRPPTEEPEKRARQAAARVGIVLPEACLAGVAANLRLLDTHLRTLRGDRT